MKNKFKTVKLFSGVAVMATLCFMASGVGAMRAPEGNNTHDYAYYEARHKEACAARSRLNMFYEAELNAAVRQWEEAHNAEMNADKWQHMEAFKACLVDAKKKWKEVYGAEWNAICRRCDECYNAMIEAKLKGYNIENSISYRFFNERGLTTMSEIVPIVEKAGKDINFVLNRDQRNNHKLFYQKMDRYWTILYPFIYTQVELPNQGAFSGQESFPIEYQSPRNLLSRE